MDQAVAFGFRLFLGSLIIIRLVSYYSERGRDNFSSRLVSLSLIMFEFLVLVAANWAFHRFIRRRRETEQMLRHNAQFARSTVDALPTHIAILDESGIVLATNHAWREFAAGSPVAVERVCEGMNYLMACDAAAGRNRGEATALAGGVRAVLAGKADEFTIEYPAHTPTERQWFVGRVTRFPGEQSTRDKHGARLVISHDNITARKLAEEEVNKAREQAELANLSKSAFLANTSHELRTPMTAILGYAEMMLDADQSPADRRSCAQTIRRNGEHLLAIINDLLDISKIEAQKVTVEKLPCPLPQLIADVIGLTRPWAIKKGLEFQVAFEGEIPSVIETDTLRTKQVLVNLMGNAIKFTEAGRVKLRIWREISYFRHTIHFEVSDSGIGMTPDQIARLFQPFTQADASTTRRFGGTGLGLTISKRLARLLGGDIAVRSSAGEGSSFTFHLDGGLRQDVSLISDLNADDLFIGADQQFVEDQCLTGRVLLAEDGEDNQHLIATHLRKAGLEVAIAVNGRQAVEQVQAQTFDLVLMDMQMPELDGYEATRALRQLGITLPIVALTANAMAEDRVRCLEAGCTDYLAKPLSRSQLLRACSKFLKAVAQPPLRVQSEAPQEAPTGTGHPAPALAVAPASPSGAGPTAPSGAAIGLRSQLENEPSVKRLLDKFIDRLPERVCTITSLLQVEDLTALRQAVHQLKGAGGGYGFPTITEQAARAESRIMAQADLESIRRDVLSLIDLIRTVDGYDRTREAAPEPPRLQAQPA